MNNKIKTGEINKNKNPKDRDILKPSNRFPRPGCRLRAAPEKPLASPSGAGPEVSCGGNPKLGFSAAFVSRLQGLLSRPGGSPCRSLPTYAPVRTFHRAPSSPTKLGRSFQYPVEKQKKKKRDLSARRPQPPNNSSGCPNNLSKKRQVFSPLAASLLSP